MLSWLFSNLISTGFFGATTVPALSGPGSLIVTDSIVSFDDREGKPSSLAITTRGAVTLLLNHFDLALFTFTNGVNGELASITLVPSGNFTVSSPVTIPGKIHVLYTRAEYLIVFKADIILEDCASFQGGSVSIQSNFTCSSGVFQIFSEGYVSLDAESSVISAPSFNISGGRLVVNVHNFINCNLTNSGSLEVTSPNILLINGTYNQTASGSFTVGNLGENRILLNVSQEASLAGSLLFDLEEDPVWSTAYDVIHSATRITGSFQGDAARSEGATTKVESLSVQYSEKDVTVTFRATEWYKIWWVWLLIVGGILTLITGLTYFIQRQRSKRAEYSALK